MSYDIDAAIARIETSKESHVAWAEHLVDEPECCTPIPKYIQTREEHLEIIAGYDNVLECLRALRRLRGSATKQTK